MKVPELIVGRGSLPNCQNGDQDGKTVHPEMLPCQEKIPESDETILVSHKIEAVYYKREKSGGLSVDLLLALMPVKNDIPQLGDGNNIMSGFCV